MIGDATLSMRFLVSINWWHSGDIIDMSMSPTAVVAATLPPAPPTALFPPFALLRSFSSRAMRLPILPVDEPPLIARRGILKLSCEFVVVETTGVVSTVDGFPPPTSVIEEEGEDVEPDVATELLALRSGLRIPTVLLVLLWNRGGILRRIPETVLLSLVLRDARSIMRAR